MLALLRNRHRLRLLACGPVGSIVMIHIAKLVCLRDRLSSKPVFSRNGNFARNWRCDRGGRRHRCRRARRSFSFVERSPEIVYRSCIGSAKAYSEPASTITIREGRLTLLAQDVKARPSHQQP